MFTEQELEHLNDAINMAIASNKRMQASKPQFAQIFRTIDGELNALKIKVNNINATPVAKK